MKKHDKYYRYRSISATLDIIEITSSEPDLEYLIQVRNVDTKEVTYINKDILLKKWKPASSGVQSKMFVDDLRNRYKKYFKKNG